MTSWQAGMPLLGDGGSNGWVVRRPRRPRRSASVCLSAKSTPPFRTQPTFLPSLHVRLSFAVSHSSPSSRLGIEDATAISHMEKKLRQSDSGWTADVPCHATPFLKL